MRCPGTLSSCVTAQGTGDRPGVSAAGLEVNGTFAGLVPSVGFSQTSAIPLEGTSDLQVEVPLPWSWC